MPEQATVEELFLGAVTVGERGQVVIPAEARENLNIHPGDKLLVFLHPAGHGVALLKLGMLEEAAAMLRRLAAELAEEHSDEDVGENG